jgi:cytosine/adenosine deaminase-related metal-dependent hydrolase
MSMPGLIDMHGHIGGTPQGTPAEYVYKLWMARCDHGQGAGLNQWVEWTLQNARSAANKIVAPRLFVYVRPGADWNGGPINSPDAAREYVRWAAAKGADGIKILARGDPVFDPPIMAALLQQANASGLGSTAHLAQMGVARMNALDAARLGMRGMEHWYGLPEALFAERTVQDYPLDYNYNDESHRFCGRRSRLWKQAASRAVTSGRR